MIFKRIRLIIVIEAFFALLSVILCAFWAIYPESNIEPFVALIGGLFIIIDLYRRNIKNKPDNNTTDDIKRKRDISTIKEILNIINIENLNTIVEELQSDYIKKEDAEYLEEINHKFNKLFRNNFHIYNEELDKKFRAFYTGLNICMNLGDYFSPVNDDIEVRYYRYDGPNSEINYHVWSKKHTEFLEKIRNTLKTNQEFFSFINENYIEI